MREGQNANANDTAVHCTPVSSFWLMANVGRDFLCVCLCVCSSVVPVKVLPGGPLKVDVSPAARSYLMLENVKA